LDNRHVFFFFVENWINDTVSPLSVMTEMIVRWFPPSWVQIIAAGRILYIDPAYLRTYYTTHKSKIEFSRWPDPIDGLPEELGPADIILVTHHHKDHCKHITVERLCDQETRVIAPRQCVKELGENIIVIKPGNTIKVEDIIIKAVNAYNTQEGNSTKKVHLMGQGVGYILEVAGNRIYHAGDTDFISEMHHLGVLDLALLPFGGTYTMDIEEAANAALAINAGTVVPIHHLRANPNYFKNNVESKSDIAVVVPGIGERIQLN
jgi:L-ascorbate metabolism protein UlaG (beta-lactamase superfamily)